MGYIYKITNLLNDKCYIGQTTRHYTERWHEHERDKNKEPYCNWPLYRMLNKTSSDSISWEVIEEVENSKLNEREQYWIKFYNSKKDGYNCTTGGNNGTKHDYDEILKYWLNEGERNFTKTAKYFNTDKSYISDIIKSMGYNRRTWEEINNVDHDSSKRKVNQIDLSSGKVIASFDSIRSAATTLGKIEYAKTIVNVCRKRRPSYLGYGWQYAEELGQPIYLNKQIKQIYLPEYDLCFDNKELCADWFIENKICRSTNRYKVGSSIHYAITHSGFYFKIKVEEREKVIYTHE